MRFGRGKDSSSMSIKKSIVNYTQIMTDLEQRGMTDDFKPRSHCPGSTPVCPGEGKPVYRDKPGDFF